MKKKIFYFSFFILLGTGLLIFSCSRDSGHQEMPAHEEHQEHSVGKLYHCPMHPEYTSDKPGECPICGMDLVPVQEEEEGHEAVEGAVRISPEKQQTIGITFGSVEMRHLHRTIRAVSRIAYDETKIGFVNTKFPGWVEDLYVDYTGKMVRKGEPMFSIYSPELYTAQQEYLLAMKASRIPSLDETILDSTRKRLLLWDLSEEQLRKIEGEKAPIKTMLFDSPMTGFVIEKDILKGKYVMPGENLYKIADISTLWILADIYENDIPLIKGGQPVEVEFSSFPSETRKGRITYIYPYLEEGTRTMKVRVEIGNPGFKLKPEMYGTTLIHLDLGKRLSVPEDAVLDSGMRKIVFIKKDDNSFEPREVELGLKASDQYEVISGIQEGDQVVTSANFLIDSESRLKAAIKKTHQH